ncbi:unnamed protein product [Linum trigynum]|uniref:Uncharacterized protein n=1 Tax=Linum trigynum TaxID=586398 RepID=A0AAV2CT70_9ROSI
MNEPPLDHLNGGVLTSSFPRVLCNGSIFPLKLFPYPFFPILFLSFLIPVTLKKELFPDQYAASNSNHPRNSSQYIPCENKDGRNRPKIPNFHLPESHRTGTGGHRFPAAFRSAADMGILYGMVARGRVVLAEFSAAQTNAGQIARQVLDKLPQGNDDTNSSYSHDRYVFHVKRTDGVAVLCMADDASERRIPFAFLEDIHGQFVRTYGRAISSAAAYAMNDEFSRVLSREMERYSNDPRADRLDRIRGEMHEMRIVMINNIEKVLERGDRLAVLVDKTAAMQGNSIRFRRQSRRYRNAMWWRNVKLSGSISPFLLPLCFS